MASEKKEKRVSVNTMEKAAKEINTISVAPKEWDWNGAKITVKPFVGISDMVQIPSYVIDILFTDDGRYLPSLKDFAVMSAFVEFFTNITLPQNIEKRFDFLYHTDIYDFVIDRIDEQQRDDILDAIDEAIDYRCESALSREHQAINDIVARFNEINEQMTNLVGDVTSADVATVFKAFASGGVSEEKLMAEYLKQRRAKSGKKKQETSAVK